MGSEYRRRESHKHYESDYEHGDSSEWYENYEEDRYSGSYESRSSERYRHRDGDRSPDRRRHHSPRSRRHSRSRSRDRDDASYHSKRGRYTGEPSHDSTRTRRRDVEPSNTVIIKGLPLKYDHSDLWTLALDQGFKPKDVRILRRRDTGISRGFGFIEFETVEEAAAWLKHTQGLLTMENNRVAEMEYSANRVAQSGSTPGNLANSQRGGDWICGKCSTNNFKKRDYCFKCGVRREDSDPICGDGFSDIGVVPSDTLLLRNLPYEVDESRVTEALRQICAEEVKQVFVARNTETSLSRGYCYVQLNTIPEAAQMLTTLTAVTKLIIDGREVLVSYSKVPLNAVLTRAALSQNVDIGSQWGDTPQPYYGQAVYSVNQQADSANAAAAVAQSAIKKAQVMRRAALENEDSFAEMSKQPMDAVIQEAASAYKLKAASQAAAAQVDAVASAPPNLGTVTTPHGELPRYPVPDISIYQYDQSSGFYYDSVTGFYYDAKTSYYFNPCTQQYVYWDAKYQTYLPAVSQVDKKNKEAAGEEAEPGKTKPAKVHQEKVKVAKKIQRDMEKWAKQLNQRKEGAAQTRSTVQDQRAAPPAKWTPVAEEPTPSSTADTAFAILGGSAVETDLQPTVGGSVGCVEEEPIGSLEDVAEEDVVDWEKLTCLLCRRYFTSKEILLKHQQLSELHKKNLQCKRLEAISTAVTASKNSSYTGRYRDRAKERREKFGLDDQPQPNTLKEKYLVESASGVAASAAPLPSESRGAKLMRGMGWQDGQGLGRKNQGITDPIMAERRIAGVGLGAAGSVHASLAGASYKDHVKAALRQKFESM